MSYLHLSFLCYHDNTKKIMEQEILSRQKIGLRLSRIGLLSKIFAIQTFVLNKFEITPEQFTVLNTLKENNGMYLRQLAQETLKDRPNMTRIVSILESQNYLTVETDKEEGRMVKKLYITKSGIKVCSKALPTILNMWENISKNIPEEEIDKFLITLDKLEENLKEKVIMQN